MRKQKLGNSDLDITVLGLGAWAMGGGGWAFSWGPQDDADSIGAIRAGVEAGMNWIDTAAVYGLGHSEEVVAQALEGLSPRPYVFTKCERVWDENRQIGKSLKRDSIRRECEASLRRLKIDVIDLYQIHWPEPDEDVEEGWDTVDRLRKEGKIRWGGVSNFNVHQLERAQKIAQVTSLQPPYSLVQPEIEGEVLPYCHKHQIGVIVYAPMKSGLLTGKMSHERLASLPPDDFRHRNPFFQEPAFSRSMGLVEVLRSIGNRHGRTPGEVAIAWTLRNPAVTAAIVGVRNPAQLDGVLGAAEFRLSAAELGEIETFRKSAAASA